MEWGYLFFILENFGFDSSFISWIRLLYSSPIASVHTNGMRLPYFSIQRGTLQGCPPSPLLFNLAIEPLAIWLRSHNGFEGIKCHGLAHKLSLYADDLLLFISNPATSLPPILNILDKLSQLSTIYKVNFFLLILKLKNSSNTWGSFLQTLTILYLQAIFNRLWKNRSWTCVDGPLCLYPL